MHGILPSEIARLVLDYLETSSCPEAARVFLETSPDLQECRRVAATGGKFITRVFGLTLINILYTFCDIYGLVQERLTKINADERLRRCGDLCEQLRTLIDDCRGQRFFVNINVPAQSTNNINNINNNNATGGSPIITSSIRKRRHSGPANKEKCNRSSKSQSLPCNETNDPNNCNANKIKALSSSSSSSLAAAASSGVAVDPPVMTKPAVNFKEPQSSNLLCDETPVPCSSTVGESQNGVQLSSSSSSSSSTSSSSQDHNEKNNQPLTKVSNNLCITNNEKLSKKKDNLTPKKLSTGTDTQELMTYSTAEVQTTPYDVMEFESETTDEPVENLSLLTKELLNRTELQERIADNINKAILPTDGLSLKDLSFSECIAGNECNTSIMTELNNAIKSIVTATEKDPVFERFFDEIFQADIEGEQDQDDDTRRNIIHSNESPIDASPKTMDECPTEAENNIIIDDPSKDKNSQLNVESEIIQTNAEFVNDPSTKIDAVDNQLLEDVNAAAVMSIINAKNKLSEKIAMETEISSNKQLNDPKYNFPVTNIIDGINNPPISNVDLKQNDQKISQDKNSQIIPIENNSSNVIKKLGRKSRVTKPKQKSIPTETVVPTLIVCNKNDINVTSTVLPVRLFNNIETENNICDGQKSQYVPIAPKNPSGPVPSTTTLYLRTVNVAKKISTSNTNKPKVDKKINDETIQNNNIVVPIEKKSTTEAITLYGISENNLTEVLEPTSLPTINIDDPVSFSDSGLSPFLKFNKKTTQPTTANEQIINTNPDDNTILRIADCDITKRTPKSLLKSRSMNHRLSLSTPRRRSGHIRALDFSTPPKEINTSRRLSEADACPYQIKSINNSKSICRTSLFKTPPFDNSPVDKQKNSRSIKTPSADSSPVPKLYGGWDKISGVGTILGCVSPTVPSLISSSSSLSSIPKNNSTIKKSWDADLRESLEINNDNDDDVKPQEKIRKRNAKMNVKGVNTNELLSKNNLIDINKSEILNNEINQNKLSTINEIDNSICDIKVLKTNLTTETITVNNKVITKKYAKLKTLATNIKRIDNNEQNNLSNVTNSSSEISEKSGELIKIHSQNLSNIAIDLETPRKNDNTLGVPPTPRVLSPSSSTPFIQVTEDTGKVRCFITTPEFPPTPCINLTPRQTLENTTDVINNEFSASYYHPSSELKDNLIKQSQNEQLNLKTNKPEITQFEVIKENLPKDEACKELNISINSKDPETSQSKKKNTSTDEKENSNDLIKINKSSEISGMTLTDSSDSESNTSSSSCSSSSSSSSSCSCNGDTTNNSSRMSTSRRSKVKNSASKSNDINSSITKLIPKINDKETSNDKSGNSCEKIERQIARIIPLDNTLCDQKEIVVVNDKNILWTKNELSPEKVIPINKTQQALDEADTETPAKDEGLLCEAEISETPSGSKCGFETLTNLTSKISAIIGAEKESNSRKYHGVLRKLDTKLSADSIKTNILASLDNVEGSNKLGKDKLINEEMIDVVNKSKNILEQQNSDKLRGKNGKIKIVNVPDTKSILEQRLKSTLKAKEQTTLRKSRKEIKNIVPKEDKNEKEEKIIDNKNEIIKNNSTDLPDKLSIDHLIIAVNSPKKDECFIPPDTSNQKISSTTDNKIVKSPMKNAKTELSVLESLKLVPASKIDIVENPEENSTKTMHNCHREFSFIHDDTVNTKKKNIKKFSSSDLEFTIQLRNDEFVTMTATKFEILFTLPSKTVRSRSTRKPKLEIQPEPKPPMKPTIRSIKTVKGITITKNKKLTPVSTVVSQPLATSSPVQIETAAKISGKIKSTNDNPDELIMNKGKNVKQDNKKQSMTTRKRKERSESKDDEPVEKKTAMINPKLLLSRVNIDEFLIAVHGPITKS
ncbi:hypothetical protein PV326_013920 [Microctonus aethiopoides]|nr:hypothetical protein PV326_013920 [Microctonus aethiopoides]